MREFVDQNQILRARERRDDAAIGEIAGTEHTGGFGPLESCEPRLKLTKQGVIAGDEARSGGAHAILADCGRGGRLECRVMGKVEIIIAGEGKQAAAFARDPWAILAQALGERASQTGTIEFLQFAASKIVQGPHGQLALIDADDSGAIPFRSDNFTGKVSAQRAYKQTKTAARPVTVFNRVRALTSPDAHAA